MADQRTIGWRNDPPDKMTPGEYVPMLLGGPDKLAKDLDIDPTTVYRWAPWPRSRPRHNREGYIPIQWHRKLLALAEKKGVALTHKQLIEGNQGDQRGK